MLVNKRSTATLLVAGCLALSGCQTVYEVFAGTFRVADAVTDDYDENLREQGVDPVRARREFYDYDR